MSSREKILSAVKASQPPLRELPSLEMEVSVSGEDLVSGEDPVTKFSTVAAAIGGRVFEVNSIDEIKERIAGLFPDARRIISSFQELAGIAETAISDPDPHALRDTDLAVLKAELGVAENGALWLPEGNMMQRILPFISQHLALVVSRNKIVWNMHEAYEQPGLENPGFGAFIAGPSKTADIEQSLVLGAHGPRSMTVFILS